MLALTDGRLFDGEAIREGLALLIEGGRIAGLVPPGDIPPGAERRSLEGRLAAPGFVDLQVNGGGGALFNDDPSPETVRTIAAAHGRFGTAGFLPTLISDGREKMRAAIAAVRAVMGEEPAPGAARVLGIHLEGPFLNPERRGVHDPAHLRAPAEGELELMVSLGIGRTLITLAPEAVPAGTIRALTRAGAIVAAGHTAATAERIGEALAEGLAGFTHLFNAMPPMAGRAPGPVGAALADGESWCGLIVDGHHVHPASLRAAVAAKPPGKAILVTDAMPPVGAPAGRFRLYGREIAVEDGRCTTDDGTLAGSALDMTAAVRNAAGLLGLPLEEALRMGSLYPAAALGLESEYGRLAPGFRGHPALL
jgi:N-acetylglucosamine-6-phosphate deacetylase